MEDVLYKLKMEKNYRKTVHTYTNKHNKPKHKN